jgi:hypothetical protein
MIRPDGEVVRDIRTPRLTTLNFANDIHRTLFVFVQLDPVMGRPFPPALIEHFDAKYPRLFTFAVMARPSVKSATWWDQHFRSAAGPVRNGVADGTWLFESGVIVGYHKGMSSVADAERFVGYFDEIVTRRMHGSGFGDEPKASESSSRSPPPPDPPPRPRPVDAYDPFGVLGLSSTATDDEVKVAWKEHMKLNHPDRVSHMSPALQKFALAQTIEIQKAYDAILTMRKK